MYSLLNGRSRFPSQLQVVVIVIIVVAFLGAALSCGPPPVVGDGAEYYLMLYSAAQEQTLSVSDASVSYLTPQFTDRIFSANSMGLVKLPNGRYDCMHFGLYSLMGVPFYGVLSAFNADAVYAFVLLHCVLLVLSLYRVARVWDTFGLTVFVSLFLTSPMVWYINKPHTELFTFCLLTICLADIWDSKPGRALFSLALLAAQNTGFVLCLIAYGPFVGWRIYHDKEQRWRNIAWLAISACVALSNPAFYYIRHGVTSLIIARGFVDPSLLTKDRLLAYFADPNIGVFTNWPIGGVLVVLSAAVAYVYRRSIGWHHAPLISLAIVTFVIFPAVHVQQINVNMGGTVDMIRYGIWLMPLLFLFGGIGASLAYRTSPRVFTVLAAIILLPAVVFSWSKFHPSQPESAYPFTAFASYLFRHHPGVYKPVIEVFTERAAMAEVGLTEIGRKGVWALSDPTCTTLFVLPQALADPDTYHDMKKPLGCREAVDPVLLLNHVLKQKPVFRAPEYVVIRREVLERSLPPIVIGTALLINTDRTNNYLGDGWAAPEPWGRWTLGRHASFGFRVADTRYEFRPKSDKTVDTDEYEVGISGVMYCGNDRGQQAVAVSVNERFSGVWRSSDCGRISRFTAPLSRGLRPGMPVQVKLDVIYPKAPTGVDPREIGFGLVSIDLSAKQRPALPISSLEVGVQIDAGTTDSQKYLLQGWNAPEGWGRWSHGKHARIQFDLRPYVLAGRLFEGPYTLRLDSQLFDQHSPGRLQSVRVAVNGRFLARLSGSYTPQSKQYVLPIKQLSPGLVSIDLEIENPTEPAWGGDNRELGVGLRSFALDVDRRLSQVKSASSRTAKAVEVPSYRPGDLIRLNNAVQDLYKLRDWCANENWGSWSCGPRPGLRLSLTNTDMVPGPYSLQLSGRLYAEHLRGREQHAEVIIDGKVIGCLRTNSLDASIKTWQFPIGWLSPGTHDIAFRIAKPLSATGQRPIGLGLESIAILPASQQ